MKDPGSISQINRVTKSIRISKNSISQTITPEEADTNTNIQVHIEQGLGNRIIKRKTALVTAPPTLLADPYNQFFVPQFSQNLYNGNQYTSNVNYRLANQQYSGNIQNNRFGKSYAVTNSKNSNEDLKTNSERTNQQVNRPVETPSGLIEEKGNYVNKNLNTKSNSGQKDTVNVNKENQQPNNDANKSSNNNRYNPYSAYRSFNAQSSPTNSTAFQIPSNDYNTIKYSSDGNANSITTGNADSVVSSVSTQRTVSTQTSRSVQFGDKIPIDDPRFKSKRKISNNGLRINLNQNLGNNSTADTANRRNIIGNDQPNQNGVNPTTPQTNATPLPNENSQVYRFATTVSSTRSVSSNTPKAPIRSQTTNSSANVQNDSSRNSYIPFYQFRAYNSADIKPFLPNSSSLNNFGNDNAFKRNNNPSTNVVSSVFSDQSTINPFPNSRYTVPPNHKPDDEDTVVVNTPDTLNSLRDNPSNVQTTQQTYNGLVPSSNQYNPAPSLNQYNPALNPDQHNPVNQPNLNGITGTSQTFQSPSSTIPNFNPLKQSFDQNSPPQTYFNSIQPTFTNDNTRNGQPHKQNALFVQLDPNQNQVVQPNFNQKNPAIPLDPNQNQIVQPNHQNNQAQTANLYPNQIVQSNLNQNNQAQTTNTPYPNHIVQSNFTQNIQAQTVSTPYPTTVPSLNADSVIVQNNGVPGSANLANDTADFVVLNRTSRFLLNKPLPSTYYALPKATIPLLPGPSYGLPPTSYNVPSYTLPTPLSTTYATPVTYSPKSVTGFDGYYGSAKAVTPNSLIPSFDVQVKGK